MAIDIGRRQFISALGGAAVAWPLAARAQQPIKPIVGFLSSQSPDTYAPFLVAFRQGLKEQGYVDGENVTIEFRWARSQTDLLPALATELVRRPVDVIAATGGVAAALAAKAATTSIPIVFNSGQDPVQAGLVTNLNRPDGNLTGVSWFGTDSAAKRLALLHQLVPGAAVIALLANPKDVELLAQLAAIKEAARQLDRKLVVENATSPSEIDAAFTKFLQQGARAITLASGPFLINQRAQVVALAAQYAIPCIYTDRESAVAGGLMSYGNNLQDGYRRNGVYVGRILKGDKPSDLPIDRATKFEFVINIKTAKVLGLDFPPTLLALADEVIE